jgi:hypothetical protein
MKTSLIMNVPPHIINKQQDYMRSVFLFLLLLIGGLIYILRITSCHSIQGIVEQKPGEPFLLSAPPFKNATPKNSPPAAPRKPSIKKKDSVLICITGRAFHEDYCTGLKKCKSGTRKLTKKEAESKGYRSCGYCYGKDE